MFDLRKVAEQISRKKILIVDADMANTFATKQLLSRWGFRVDSVDNGVRCLEYLRNYSDVDMILMDHVMLEMDGEECIRKLRSNIKTINIPVIMHTATATKGSRNRFICAGADEYISKPVNFSEMKQKISKLVFGGANLQVA